MDDVSKWREREIERRRDRARWIMSGKQKRKLGES